MPPQGGRLACLVALLCATAAYGTQGRAVRGDAPPGSIIDEINKMGRDLCKDRPDHPKCQNFKDKQKAEEMKKEKEAEKEREVDMHVAVTTPKPKSDLKRWGDSFELDRSQPHLDAGELDEAQRAKLEAQREAQLEAQREAQLEAQREAQLEEQREAQLEAQREAKLEAQREEQQQAQQQGPPGPSRPLNPAGAKAGASQPQAQPAAQPAAAPQPQGSAAPRSLSGWGDGEAKEDFKVRGGRWF